MPSVELVPFHGDLIQAIRDPDKICRVSIACVCEILGLSYENQLKILKQHRWSDVDLRPVLQSDGTTRNLGFIPLEQLPMWMAGIHADKIDLAIRAKLIAFQREARDVLATYFIPQANIQRSEKESEIDLIVKCALALQNLERRIATDEAKIKQVEQKTDLSLDMQTVSNGRLIIVPWLSRRGYILQRVFESSAGIRMSKFSRSHGDEPRNYPPKAFQGIEVSTYRQDLLEQWLLEDKEWIIEHCEP